MPFHLSEVTGCELFNNPAVPLDKLSAVVIEVHSRWPRSFTSAARVAGAGGVEWVTELERAPPPDDRPRPAARSACSRVAGRPDLSRP